MQTLPYPQTPMDHALCSFDLIFPELVQYRSGWFRADRFDASNADQWFEQFDGDVSAVERMVNHLDVGQDDPQFGPSGEYDTAHTFAFAKVLEFVWPLWAKAAYGVDIEIGVYLAGDERDPPDPETISFWSKGPAS